VSTFRRIVFQGHRWVGLIAGVYVLLISVTGAALVFRIDLQRASHPHLFTANAGAPVAPLAIIDSVSRAYPAHRLSGVDAPTTTRPTYLAYVTSPDAFKTILIDPVTARVLGELPERTAVRTLQDLHFDLLSGRTGRVVNGVGALAIIVLVVTGILEWWRRGLSWRKGRFVPELHRAVGIGSAALVLMWAITGAYFAFPSTFRAAIGAVSALSVNRTPPSQCASPEGSCAAAAADNVLAAARLRHPNAHIARVVLPFGERGSWLVMFTDRQPTPAYTELESVYVDQYTGAVIEIDRQRGTVGDRIIRWLTTLHVGSFGGTPTRLAWFVFGIAPALLAITGAVAWLRK
jgi:uncharacterized iron-regulated membrane protein